MPTSMMPMPAHASSQLQKDEQLGPRLEAREPERQRAPPITARVSRPPAILGRVRCPAEPDGTSWILATEALAHQRDAADPCGAAVALQAVGDLVERVSSGEDVVVHEDLLSVGPLPVGDSERRPQRTSGQLESGFPSTRPRGGPWPACRGSAATG